jgi:hypothetical protein
MGAIFIKSFLKSSFFLYVTQLIMAATDVSGHNISVLPSSLKQSNTTNLYGVTSQNIEHLTLRQQPEINASYFNFTHHVRIS